MPQKPEGVSWESFAEYLIQQAQAKGEFDQLPGFGKPIPGLEADTLDENWWIRDKLRRENLSVLPPSLQIRVDMQQTISKVWGMTTEKEVRECITQLNQRIATANRSLEQPPSTVMPVDLEEIVARWKALQSDS